MVRDKGIVITIVNRLFRVPVLRKLIWGRLYELIAHFYPNKSWVFMNYGFTGTTPHYTKLDLHTNDEPNRYFIQLYEYILGKINLAGKRILEVGSGRGGGTSYLTRYHKPEMCVGLDYSKNAVAFCTRTHKIDGLTYKVGNAESLPFPKESFDAIVNVESSHCYNTREKFLHEVKRVLKPGGYFFYTDVIDKDNLKNLREEIHGTRLNVLKEEDISQNVMCALDEDGERRYDFFKKTMHPIILRYFKEFAGNRTSEIYRKISNGISIYYHYILEKAAIKEHPPGKSRDQRFA
jgi:ubiquinone/menaquinone biosynthesis C-methylase UbiE